MSSQPSDPTGTEKLPPRKDSDADVERTELEHSRRRDNTVDGLHPSNLDPRLDPEERKRLEASAKLENPLAGLSQSELSRRGEEFCAKHGFNEEEDIRAFKLGAMIAGNMNKYDTVDGLNDREREVLDREITHKWSNPSMLYAVIVICSLCAAVQGMDETVVNGAQIFYKVQFGIEDSKEKVAADLAQKNSWLVGLTNSAPYICCAFIGCWLTEPMNKLWGRRGTVFISCLISAAACFWQAFTNTWWHMFIARFFLGLGIGPKSATTPIFAAECSPPKLRGALVMQWQMWTAFGIMIGYVADLAFYYGPDMSGIYLFGMVYSPGEGPVPFTYSAEAYPLYIRPLGMSLATATTWFFNAVLSLTWPSLVQSWTNQGAFSWYASWNLVGWVLVLFFVPETKEKTLEELDAVFNVPVRSLISYGAKQFFYFWGHHILRRDIAPPKVPSSRNTVEYTEKQFTKERQHDPTARV
ncbi:putative Major facilitator superfamily (MFS) profile domain-containing protein [Seiridium cardinale]|uniref:Major facilitator superfamily (MFS) profile domain-containing protein n=1 Tax=Seiridium cardinale TaxID=138064 RepID=A0ABR2XYE6_9PEZI